MDLKDDIYNVPEYEFLFTNEKKHIISPLNILKNIPENHTKILIKWMEKLNSRLKNNIETLFLSVSILYKFLNNNRPEKIDFKLLGITCIGIATKFNENEELFYIIEIILGRLSSNFNISYESCSMEIIAPKILHNVLDMTKMEANILLDIDFAVNIPTTRDFLLFYIHEAQISHKDVIKLSENIIHTLLTDLDILKFLPSMIGYLG